MKLSYASLFLLLGVACASHGAQPGITGNSVGDFVVGRSVPKIDRSRLLHREWQHDENGDNYEQIRFNVRETAVEAEVYDGKVWRISIDQPGLLTEDEAEVGSKALRLLDINPTIQPQVGPGPMIVLVPTKPCGISYLTDAEPLNEVAQVLTRNSVAPLLSSARVTRILVTGCSAKEQVGK